MKARSKLYGAVKLLPKATAVLAFCINLGLASQLDAQTERVSVGDDFGAVIDDTGSLFIWGGVLDPIDGSIERIEVPGAWREVSVSRTTSANAHFLAIASDGTLWAWGSNARGQLGIGNQTDQEEPVQVSSATDWVEVAAGEFHSLARRSNGLVFAWGDNTNGQLNRSPISSDPALDLEDSLPSSPIDVNSYIAISAANSHSHAIRADGSLWAWGTARNDTQITGPHLGVLINGDFPIGALRLTQVLTANQSDTQLGWTDLFAGYNATFATRNVGSEIGQLWVWGQGANLGLGSGAGAALASLPTRVGSDLQWSSVSLSAGDGDFEHALGVRLNGDLYGWGINASNIDSNTRLPDSGALGLPVLSDGLPILANFYVPSPVPLLSGSSFWAVGAGDRFSVVVGRDGFMRSAGINDLGQLANGSIDATPETGQPFFDNSRLGGIDLVAVSVEITEQAQDIVAGSPVSVSLEIRNDGTGLITDAFSVSASLNTSDSFGGQPLTFVGGASEFVVNDDFAVGQSQTVALEVELPNSIVQGSSYQIVLRVDSEDVIVENDEGNNDRASSDIFAFLPDLVVTTGPDPQNPVSGLVITNVPGNSTFDPLNGDQMEISLEIENLGSGTLPAGTLFDVRLFLSPSRSATHPQLVDLTVSEELTLASDLAAGATISQPFTFTLDVPFLAEGAYFLGVELDVGNRIVEQVELKDDFDIVVRDDGEGNNFAFTDGTVSILGLQLDEALDQAGILTFATDGDGDWFGQASFSNDGFDAAQSPSLVPGESASFSTSFTTPVAVSFDWSASTSSQQNRLSFRVVNGNTAGNVNSIAGTTDDWIENVTRVVPLNARAEWVYEQVVEGADDAVYVDDLQFTTIDRPDLTIDDIYLPSDAAGSYVLQRDTLDLTINSRNQGTSTPVGENYVISIYLSDDATFDRPDGDPLTPDDILVRQELIFSTEAGEPTIAGGDTAVNGFVIDLPEDLVPGQYYVIGYIDDYTDAQGVLLTDSFEDNLTGTTLSSSRMLDVNLTADPLDVIGDYTDGSGNVRPGQSVSPSAITGDIEEFEGLVGSSSFPGESNNLFITDGPLIEVRTLPDLDPLSLTADLNYIHLSDPESGYKDPNNPAAGYAQPNNLDFSFKIRNIGISPVNDSFDVRALFSRDTDFDLNEDYSYLEYSYNDGLSARDELEDSGADQRTIRPDRADFRQNIIEQGYIGERLYFGILADSGSVIEEFNETNNTDRVLENVLILSEFNLQDALDITDATMQALNINIINDEEEPYDGNAIPWVGQSGVSFDGVHAATSVLVGRNEASEFSVTLDPANPVRVSFRWRVSSQDTIEGRDQLRFLVDGIDAVNPIFGTEEDGWVRVEVTLPAIAQTLTWRYEKNNDDISLGEDRGWVDRLEFDELPNIAVTGLSVETSEVYRPDGDSIDTWTVSIINNGSIDIPSGDSFDVELRLSPSGDWTDGDAVTVLTLTDTAGLAAGQTRTYNQDSYGPLTIPSGDYPDEFYFAAVYADWSTADVSNGQIVESIEATDNLLFSDLADVQIGQPDILTTGVSFAAGAYTYQDPVNVQVSLDNIGDGVFLSDSSFDIRVFLVPNRVDGVASSSQARELGVITISGIEVAAGDSLPVQTLVTTLPYGISNGDYFVGVLIDPAEELLEQSALSVDAGDARDRNNGEGNNLFFTNTAGFNVDNGITIPEAIDQPALSVDLNGDGQWFSRNGAGDLATSDDDQVFVGDDGVQSPVLSTGESASFSFVSDDSYVISFDYVVATASSATTLTVEVDGVEAASFSGSAFGTAEFQVASGDVVSWIYTQSDVTPGDVAYVDNVVLTSVNVPDLQIETVELITSGVVVPSGSYVLGRDALNLSAVSRNLGTDVTTDFEMEFYLSRDAELTPDDRLIRTFFEDNGEEFLSGNTSINGFSVDLPTDLEAGSYYLITVIDSGNTVVEFSELNNTYVTPTAAVEIVRLPDLVVRSFTATPDYYLLEDESIVPTGRGFLDFEFEIENQGLADVEGPLSIRILFSADNQLDADGDYVVLEYTYEGNLTQGATQLIDPDSVDLRDDIPLGAFQFMGVVIDAGDVILESFEANNGTFVTDNNFLFSLRELEEGLDLDPVTIADQNITLINDESAPFDTDALPWVVQAEESFDGEDALTNVLTSGDQVSTFSMTLEPTVPTRVAFQWRVDSAVLPDDAGFAGTLRFAVDGVEVNSLIGENLGWRRVAVTLDPGVRTLTWSFSMDGIIAEGGRGWVDSFTLTELPNLSITGISVDGTPSYQAGDTIGSWSVDIVNNGDEIPAGVPFDVEVRLLPSATWSESGAITLLTITDSAGLGENETRTYSNVTDGELTLPIQEYPLEYYYLGAYVDWSLDNPVDGQIDESNEAVEDNTEFTEEASIQIGRPDLSLDGSVITVDAASYAFTDNVGIEFIVLNQGDGALQAGTSFDYEIFLSLVDDVNVLSSSSSVLLGTGSVNIGAGGVPSGDPLPTVNFTNSLPYGMADGDYFVAVVLDRNDVVREQGLNRDGTGSDGEENNTVFSTSKILTVQGVSIFDAVEDGTTEIAYVDGDAVDPAGLPALRQNLESSALWFGRDNNGDTISEDDEPLFVGGNGVQTPALSEGEFAEFSLSIPDSSLVRFAWRGETGSDLNVLTVSVDGDEVYRISGSVELTEVDPAVLVPDDGIVTWRYTKGAATTGDFALVDNIRISANDDPDLVLTELNYGAGEYVLDVLGIAGAPDQLLGTENLDITVTATNIGATLELAPGDFTSADIEVRLSTDRIFGNDNDIILGSISPVEGFLGSSHTAGEFTSGGIASYLGPINLVDSIPEGSYYLMARIDANREVDEFSEQNNILISEEADIQITRLPALRIYNPDPLLISEGTNGVTNFLDPRESGAVAFDLDEDFNYTGESPMRLRFGVQNIGLDRIEANEQWAIRVDLIAALREDLTDAATEGDADAYFDAFTLNINLGEFTVSQLMEGRSEESPEGQILDFELNVDLPNIVRLDDLIAADRSISEYLWAIEVDLDGNDQIRQSEIIRESPQRVIPPGLPWRIVDPFEGLLGDISAFNTDLDEGAFGIGFQPFLASASVWQEDFFGFPTILEENLLAYALNRNPADGDTIGGQFTGGHGIDQFQGNDVFTINFDIITRTTDLIYYVEAADVLPINSGAAGYSLLATVDGPFDSLVGPSSLNGDGGLDSEPNVISVLDRGYSARVTVKDSQNVGDSLSRFLHVRIGTPYDAYVEALLGAGHGPFGDKDGDGETNIVEILTGATPDDANNFDGSFAPLTDIITASYFANRGVVPGAINTPRLDILASDDFDGDGVSNLVELITDRDPAAQPTDDDPVVTAAEAYVISEMAALGVIPGTDGDTTSGVALEADYDSDGKTNIVELQLGTDPTDGGDVPVSTALEDFVVTEMAKVGAFGANLVAILPDGDQDSDGKTNIVELQNDTNPNGGGSVPATTDLEDYVVTQMANLGVFSNPAPGLIAPDEDFDSDGKSNIVELQSGTDPTKDFSVAVSSLVEDFVITQMANFGAFGGNAMDILPSEDNDGNGASNLAEIAFTVALGVSVDPTTDDAADDAYDTPAELDTAVDAFIDAQYGPGDYTASGNPDGDAFTNLEELALGTDPLNL